MKIYEANPSDTDLFGEILAVQLAAYEIESRLIEYPDFPPLRQTVQDLRDSGERFLVCSIDGRVAGAISFSEKDGVADICRLVVSPQHFGKGIGTMLVQEVEMIATGCSRIIVSTAWRNVPAVRLYQKCGYHISRRHHLPDGLELVELEKDLSEK